MARKLRTPRYPVVTTGRFGKAVPVAKALVEAGSTLRKLSFRNRFQSMPIKYPLTGGYLDVEFYYVPMSAAWDEWIDFVLGETVTFPTLAAAQPNFFTSAANSSKLYGLCYEAVINKFHRTSEDDPYTYDGSWASLPRVDMTAEFSASADHRTIDETVNIADGLTVREIDDARAKLRYRNRMDFATGHYADWLKEQGVAAHAVLGADPERIGRVSKFVMPSKSIDPSTGGTTQSYFRDIELTLDKDRYFAEAGYIVGILSMRPKIMPYGSSSLEDAWREPIWFPHKGQPKEYREQPAGVGGIDGTQSMFTDDFLAKGQSLCGPVDDTKTQLFLTYNPTSLKDARIPQAAYDDMLSGASPLVGGAHYQVDGVLRLELATPLSIVKRP